MAKEGKTRRKRRRGPGEGSIVQRKDGRWQASIQIGYNPETGKPKRKYFYGATRKEVQEKSIKEKGHDGSRDVGGRDLKR